MGGSIIKAIKKFRCGWDGKELQAHSHKGLMKCLYKSNVDLFKASQLMEEKQKEINSLQGELGRHLIKEQTAKEDTGIMDVKEPINIVDAPPLNIGKDKTKNDKEPPIDITDTIKDEKKLASILLEAESVIKNGRDTK